MVTESCATLISLQHTGDRLAKRLRKLPRLLLSVSLTSPMRQRLGLRLFISHDFHRRFSSPFAKVKSRSAEDLAGVAFSMIGVLRTSTLGRLDRSALSVSVDYHFSALTRRQMHGITYMSTTTKTVVNDPCWLNYPRLFHRWPGWIFSHVIGELRRLPSLLKGRQQKAGCRDKLQYRV